jgi:hypothetical protein
MEAAMVAFERDHGSMDEVLFKQRIESKVLTELETY